MTPRRTPEYIIPITVPPGRGGIQPKLSLVQTGDMGNGMLGQGWALRGLSRIERCPKTVAQDGQTQQVNLTAADAFCIDGKRLVPDSDNGGTPTHLYHTEIESFQLIQPFGSQTDASGNYIGPDGFTVWTKSGQILTYGLDTASDPNTANSIVKSQQVNRVWSLSKVEDHVGNYMLILYQQFHDPVTSDTSEILPSAIYYDGQASTAEMSGNSTLSTGLSVSFQYEPRTTDPRFTYVLGTLTESTMRLKTIGTYVDGQNVLSYTISYTTQVTTQYNTQPSTWLVDASADRSPDPLLRSLGLGSKRLLALAAASPKQTSFGVRPRRD